MCSAVSSSPADSVEALLAAVAEVTERSLCAVTTGCGRAAFDLHVHETATEADGDDGWVLSSVAFAGDVRGRLVCVCPSALARRLGAAYIGSATPATMNETDVIDFAGEFANMICGTWLTRTCAGESFRICPPAVDRQPTIESVIGRPTAPDVWRVHVAIDETPFRVDIEWLTARTPDNEGDDAR